MTKRIPLTLWQEKNTPAVLPHHVRRNIEPGSGGCWLWTKSRSRDGYGWASLNEKTYQAHRFVYTIVIGPIPDGLQLDHLCRVRHCVNPSHLEPVTVIENLKRGVGPAGQDRCQRCGSEFVMIGKAAPQRRCQKCRDEYQRVWMNTDVAKAKARARRVALRARRAACA